MADTQRLAGALDWRSGGVGEWGGGGVVEWRSGGVAEWWSGGVVEWLVLADPAVSESKQQRQGSLQWDPFWAAGKLKWPTRTRTMSGETE